MNNIIFLSGFRTQTNMSTVYFSLHCEISFLVTPCDIYILFELKLDLILVTDGETSHFLSTMNT